MIALQKSKSAILSITNENVDRLFKKWSNMFNEPYCTELTKKLCVRVENFYNDLIIESNEKEQLLKDKIKALRDEAADIKRLLHKNLKIEENPKGMPLETWMQTLDESIEHLRKELSERHSEICELLSQQDQLCEELGELPQSLLTDPLPKPEDISAFRKHLDYLAAERANRMERLHLLRTKIKEDMKLLGISSNTAAAEHLLSKANRDLTMNTIEKLTLMRIEFNEQVQEMRTKIDEVREKIYVLWERLPETDDFAKRRVREAKEYTQATYDVLMDELQSCQTRRRQNLKSFILLVRAEIKEWWDLTLKSEKERNRFSHYYSMRFNEDLLELHELELDDLKSYYNSNKEIFELFTKRCEFWARMDALEAKATQPNRYNNRGGQLLQEERERNAIRNKLPKIEQQITSLVKAYELRNKSPFLVHGENILEVMSNDWNRLRQSKLLQSSRKRGCVNASIDGKMSRNISVTSKPTISSRKPATNSQVSPKINSVPKSTKRKLDFSSIPENVNTKPSLMHTLKGMKPSPLVQTNVPRSNVMPAKQQQIKSHVRKIHVLDNLYRRSYGLKRRSVKGPNLPKPTICVHPPSSDEDDNNDDDTYGTFEKSISLTGRSSIRPR